MSNARSRRRLFVQIVGVGIYGDKRQRLCDEATAPATISWPRFLNRWEADSFCRRSRRAKFLLRLGVVLGTNGGFLEVLGRLTRWFLGGQVGSGRQYISWIHITDLSRMVLAGVEIRNLPALLTPAPEPGPQCRIHARNCAGRLHRPWSPPVPEFAARIGSWWMGRKQI